MKIIKDSKGSWIEGKENKNYKKRILMNEVPPSVNLIQDVIIPPGGNVPSHRHSDTAEIFYITKGSVVMVIEKKDYPLSERDMIFIDVGEEHGFRNESDDDLEMIVMKINFKEHDAILYDK